MTREEAGRVLRCLAHGLAADMAGCSRLLERVSVDPEAETLRDLLTEEGARRLLDEEARSCSLVMGARS